MSILSTKSIKMWIDKEYETAFSYDFTEHTEQEIRDFWNWTWWTLQTWANWVYAAYGANIWVWLTNIQIYPMHTMTVTITGTTRGASGSNAWSTLDLGFRYHDNWYDSGAWIESVWWWQNLSSSTNMAYTSTITIDFDNWLFSCVRRNSTMWSDLAFDWQAGLETVRNGYLKFGPGTIRVKTIDIQTT